MDDIVSEDEDEEGKVKELVESIDEDRKRDIGRIVNGDKIKQRWECDDETERNGL